MKGNWICESRGEIGESAGKYGPPVQEKSAQEEDQH